LTDDYRFTTYLLTDIQLLVHRSVHMDTFGRNVWKQVQQQIVILCMYDD